jgi:hypothetical protein
MVRAETDTERDLHAEARDIVADMRASVASGEDHWFTALLSAVRRWPLPAERVGERDYRYLVGGEAFDWLLLAERLCSELTEFAPEDEIEALLFHEQLPLDTTERDFEQLMGAKYKPHLNYVYGVRVESALHMAIGEEIRKERHSTRIWEQNGHADDEAFRRIYGRERVELLSEFRGSTGCGDGEWLTLPEYAEWRYWLFQYRVRYSDPAKVASDTRKGLALLQRLERSARNRHQSVVE